MQKIISKPLCSFWTNARQALKCFDIYRQDRVKAFNKYAYAHVVDSVVGARVRDAMDRVT